jgi:hypothetical protein
MSRLLTVVLLLLATPVMADECFTVIAPVAPGSTVGAPPGIGALKVNRCTGETWVLTLITVPTVAGKSGGTVWRWTPITVESHEAVWPHQ